MRNGDFGDDNGFTDVQMLMEVVQIMDEANPSLVVVYNWSPMSIKTNH